MNTKKREHFSSHMCKYIFYSIRIILKCTYVIIHFLICRVNYHASVNYVTVYRIKFLIQKSRFLMLKYFTISIRRLIVKICLRSARSCDSRCHKLFRHISNKHRQIFDWLNSKWYCVSLIYVLKICDFQLPVFIYFNRHVVQSDAIMIRLHI